MSWSRTAVFGGIVAVVFSALGVATTISDPQIGGLAALGVALIVAGAFYLGSEALLGVAAAVAGIGWGFGGLAGVAEAGWGAGAVVVALAGLHLGFDTRRPARLAVGALRAMLTGNLAVACALGAAVLTASVLTSASRIWIVGAMVGATVPLFALPAVGRGRQIADVRLRTAMAGAVSALVAVVVVSGAVAMSVHGFDDATGDQQPVAASEPDPAPTAINPFPGDDIDVEPDAPPTGEWLAALGILFLGLAVIALLATNLLRDQPIEFKPAEATPGDGQGTVTDVTVSDPELDVWAEQAADLLERAMVPLEQVDDPGQAVRLAYSLVESGFGALGAQRHEAESESEYLRRLLPQLGVSGTAMTHLTTLFELARFSSHPIDDTMRSEALTALDAVRDELLTAQPATEQPT